VASASPSPRGEGLALTISGFQVRIFDAQRNDTVLRPVSLYPISRSTVSTALRSSAVNAAWGAMGSPTS
jgi:hypothetical protein